MPGRQRDGGTGPADNNNSNERGGDRRGGRGDRRDNRGGGRDRDERNHLERVAEATPNPLARVKAG